MKNVNLSAREEQILNDIYRLILDESLTSQEREVLTKAKNLIESGDYVPQIVQRIQVNVTLLALNGKLSPNARKFSQQIPERLYEILPFGSVPLGINRPL
ncbi:bacteriocin immunity protein [Lactococcus petauri]